MLARVIDNVAGRGEIPTVVEFLSSFSASLTLKRDDLIRSPSGARKPYNSGLRTCQWYRDNSSHARCLLAGNAFILDRVPDN